MLEDFENGQIQDLEREISLLKDEVKDLRKEVNRLKVHMETIIEWSDSIPHIKP